MVANLKKLQSLLKKRKYLSAEEIAKELEVSLPTVYRQIKALKNRGATVAEMNEPRSRPGPRPTRFAVLAEVDL